MMGVASGLGCVAALCVSASSTPQQVPVAYANDNRTPAGTWRGDTLVLRLTVVEADWHPLGDDDPAFRLLTFAEEGKAPSVPGPLIRVRTDTPIMAVVRNPLTDTLIVMGLGPHGDGAPDSLRIAPGATEEALFTAGAQGSYLYRAYTSMQLPPSPTPARRRQLARFVAQLAGAFVVDPPGAVPEDRIMVITTLADPPRSSPTGELTRDRYGVPQREFNAVNGKMWPHSERFTHAIGDTIRWRVLNASFLIHPMHLHGFYFRVDARGNATADVDTVYAPADRDMVVTERIEFDGTRTIVWSPDRPGGWIFHCHLTQHVVRMPPIDRRDSVAFPTHDHHTNPDEHAMTGMSGLVTAVTVTGRPTSQQPEWRPAKRLRIYVQSDSVPGDSVRRFGYVLERGAAPARDSVDFPGAVLVLTRGEPTSIEVVNRTDEPTAVHWHGIELESYYDGTVGWGGTPGVRERMTPAIRPGATFEARMTPQRAGTFMYHTHFDEMRQQFGGLIGGLVVLEPGEQWDQEHDLLVLISTGLARRIYFNALSDPPPLQLVVGERYRLRIADIAVQHPRMDLRLVRDSTPVTWKPLAKDGFPVPQSRARLSTSTTAISSGETADFEFAPDAPGELRLEMIPGGAQSVVATLRLHVRPR